MPPAPIGARACHILISANFLALCGQRALGLEKGPCIGLWEFFRCGLRWLYRELAARFPPRKRSRLSLDGGWRDRQTGFILGYSVRRIVTGVVTGMMTGVNHGRVWLVVVGLRV